jgi:hypothetical protein
LREQGIASSSLKPTLSIFTKLTITYYNVALKKYIKKTTLQEGSRPVGKAMQKPWGQG